MYSIVAALIRAQRKFMQRGFRAWYAATQALGQSERQADSAQTLATAQQVVHAATVRLSLPFSRIQPGEIFIVTHVHKQA